MAAEEPVTITVWALVAVQLSSEVPPVLTLVGLAEQELIVGCAHTLTVALHVSLPPAPVTVSVYVEGKQGTLLNYGNYRAGRF